MNYCCLSWILIIRVPSTTKKEFWEITAYVANLRTPWVNSSSKVNWSKQLLFATLKSKISCSMVGWLQREGMHFQAYLRMLDLDFFFSSSNSTAESVPVNWTHYEDHPVWKVIQGQERPWRPFWVSASALYPYYWQHQSVSHSGGQLVPAGSNITELPAMLALHYTGLAFLRHSLQDGQLMSLTVWLDSADC